MKDQSIITDQPQQIKKPETIYYYESNPIKRAALFALLARIKDRLALEQGNISADKDVTENQGPT